MAQKNETPASNITSSVSGPAQAAPARTGESLEQVREILFGAQTREMDQRLAQMRQQMVEKLEQFERETRDTLKRLGDQLESMRSEQAKAMEQSAKKESDARDAVRSEAMRQIGDLNRKCDATAIRVNEMADQLRSELVDRPTLSAVLSEAALRLGAPALASSAQDQDDAGMDALLSSRMVDRPSGAGKGTPGDKR